VVSYKTHGKEERKLLNNNYKRDRSVMSREETRARLMEALEEIADYAAMMKGAMAHLEEAGLSQEAAEAVLMSIMDIPGWVVSEFSEEEDD
jgi:hypothetical protein